jgi:hypothetical protein
VSTVLLTPVNREWVSQREAILIEQENEMFRVARDRATTAEERAYWDEFIQMRERNLKKKRPGA